MVFPALNNNLAQVCPDECCQKPFNFLKYERATQVQKRFLETTKTNDLPYKKNQFWNLKSLSKLESGAENKLEFWN